MAQNKKDFTAEAAGVFVDKMIAPAAEPKPQRTSTARRATPERKPIAKPTPNTNAAGTEIKVCFMLDVELERKLRYIAFAERCKQKTIVTDALTAYIADYEKTRGAIK